MRTAIQLILGVVVIGLAYLLYHTITDPWEEYQVGEFTTELTRARMANVRSALIDFRDVHDGYPTSLDSLVHFLKTDSAFSSQDLNVVFPVPRGGVFVADSLPFSPRTGKPFDFQIVSDDTSGVSIYYLKDPDTEDHIGSETPNPALRNVASWE